MIGPLFPVDFPDESPKSLGCVITQNQNVLPVSGFTPGREDVLFIDFVDEQAQSSSVGWESPSPTSIFLGGFFWKISHRIGTINRVRKVA